MRQAFLSVALIFGSHALISDVRAADITRGEMLSLSCFACHGPDGNSPGEIPSINGKSAKFLVQVLHDFKESRRETTVMKRQLAGYSDEEIQLIAEYFSSMH